MFSACKKAGVLATSVLMFATCLTALGAFDGTSALAASNKTHYPLTINNCGTSETFTRAPSRVILMNGASVAEVETMIELGLQKKILGRPHCQLHLS
jgi:iron complex transport system substrate-binding protein